jgi:hypothetical protein
MSQDSRHEIQARVPFFYLQDKSSKPLKMLVVKQMIKSCQQETD